MSAFDWIVAAIVIVSMVYVSFVLTLRDWFSALRKGQAVTLLPERPGRRPWPLWTQVAMVLLGLALCLPLFYYGWIPLFLLPASKARILAILGLLIYAAGTAFMLWARRTLGKFWGISTSQNVKLLDEHELIQGGPYTYIRHPMYFGAWVSFFGLTMVYPVWAIALLFFFSLISFASRARREEAALSQHFGAQWTEYKQRTKMLIPFLF